MIQIIYFDGSMGMGAWRQERGDGSMGTGEWGRDCVDRSVGTGGWGWVHGMGVWGQKHEVGSIFLVFCFQKILILLIK